MTQTHLGGDSSGGAVGSDVAGVRSPGRASIAARTLRTDRWWVQPVVTFTLLVIWLLYALIRTASQRYYFVEDYHYLSPFSSPCVTASCVPASRDLGTWFGDAADSGHVEGRASRTERGRGRNRSVRRRIHAT
jgi:hypothetical protein